MSTKRTPLVRLVRHEITDEAVRLFRAMERVECTCLPRDWQGEYWKHVQCEGCVKWWQLHSKLHDELRLPPHYWPAYEPDLPDAELNPFPEGCPAWRDWRSDKRGQATTYRALRAAAAAPRRARPPRKKKLVAFLPSRAARDSAGC